MRLALRIQPDAEHDVRQAFQWYEDQKPGLGREFLDCVEQAFVRICENPDLHGVVYRTVRQTLVRRFPYVVCYAIEADQIDVIAVFHGHRGPARLAIPHAMTDRGRHSNAGSTTSPLRATDQLPWRIAIYENFLNNFALGE